MQKAPSIPKNPPRKTKIAVFIDAANFEISLKMCLLKADYRELIRFIKQQFSSKFFIRYYKVDFQTKAQNRFFSKIKNLGFKIVTKKIKIIRQRKITLHKANFDVEIAFDTAIRINDFDQLILFSGDSDFVYLAKQLQKRKKEITIISPRFRTAKELRQMADQFIDLRNCPFVTKIHKKLPQKREDHDNLSTARIIYKKK